MEVGWLQCLVHFLFYAATASLVSELSITLKNEALSVEGTRWSDDLLWGALGDFGEEELPFNKKRDSHLLQLVGELMKTGISKVSNLTSHHPSPLNRKTTLTRFQTLHLMACLLLSNPQTSCYFLYWPQLNHTPLPIHSKPHKPNCNMISEWHLIRSYPAQTSHLTLLSQTRRAAPYFHATTQRVSGVES